MGRKTPTLTEGMIGTGTPLTCHPKVILTRLVEWTNRLTRIVVATLSLPGIVGTTVRLAATLSLRILIAITAIVTALGE